MQRHKIILGEHIYIVDRFEAGSLLTKTKNNFVMLRKYDFMDDMSFDTDVYVIDKEIYERWKNDKIIIAFPNTYSNVEINQTTTFSSNISKFNESFIYNDNELVPILQENGIDLADIDCDILRIYHPHTKVHQDYIIYIDSYINSIHWHFYCLPVNQLKTHSETEFQIENVYYSEYVEFTIPNIEALFYNTYYNDEINVIEGYEDTSNIPMILFKTPFKIEEENGQFYKSYIDLYTYKDKDDKLFCEDSSRFTNNLNVTFYPYVNVDVNTTMYIMDENLAPNSCQFINEVKFTLSAKFILNELPMLICEFNLPNSSIFDNFIDAYQYYNNVTLDEYKTVKYIAGEDDDEEEAELYGDKDGQLMKLCGFKLTIANDIKFKNIIYEKTNWDYEFDDFSFQLNDIFEKWEQYPDIIICKAEFIDRYLGNIITSNQVIITKEQFKYLINDTAKYRVILPNNK